VSELCGRCLPSSREENNKKYDGKRRRAMQRVTTKFLFVLALLVLALPAWEGGIATASSVHFKHGSPQAFDNGLTLTMSGILAGLGNGDLVVNLSATADPTTVCANQGGNEAPGQNPGAITVTGSVAIPGSAIKNGNAPFIVTTDPPSQPTAEQAGCPNDNWTASITDMKFTSATLTVLQQQADGSFLEVLSVTFTFSPPTENGPVPLS
jgi:hypothetical protein